VGIRGRPLYADMGQRCNCSSHQCFGPPKFRRTKFDYGVSWETSRLSGNTIIKLSDNNLMKCLSALTSSLLGLFNKYTNYFR